MKFFLSFSLFCLALMPGTLSATALLRQTSAAQNQVAAPPEGELVYAVNEDGTVNAYVGCKGLAAPISDPLALRLTPAAPFSPGQLDIGSTGAITKDAEGVAIYDVGVITITQIHKEPIGAVDYEAYAPPGSLTPPSASVTVSIVGNVATLTVTSGQITRLSVMGNATMAEVDLCARDVLLTDTRGKVKLSQMRSSVINHFAGRTADCWSDFPAARAADLNGHALFVDAPSGHGLAPSGDGLALYAARRPAIAAAATITANDAVSGALTVTQFTLGANSVTLAAQLSGIDADAVELQYTPTLSPANWLTLTPSSRTLEGDSLTLSAPRISGKNCFYRLVAGETVSLLISVMGDLDVHGKLILRSPSGKRFALAVADDGTLSAAELTQ